MQEKTRIPATGRQAACVALLIGFPLMALSEDLRAVDPNRIPEVRVLRTVVGGRQVFAAQ